MARAETILDKKIVVEDFVGNEMAWVLVQDDKTGETSWKPRAISVADSGEKKYTNPVWMPLPGSQYTFLECPVFETLYEGTRGPGKRLSNEALLLSDSGWKRVGDITMDDRLVAPDGTYTRIKGIYPHESGTMYRVTFDDGASIECDGDHLWAVRSGRKLIRDGWVTRSTDWLIESMKRSERNVWFIPTMKAPAPGKKWRGLDPYAIGLLLANGIMKGKNATLYTCDDWIENYMVSNHGWESYDYGPKPDAMMIRCPDPRRSEEWKDVVGRHEITDKRVPRGLIEADPDARLACLQGLMDSGGHIDNRNACSFTSISENLAKNVQYLTRSLGGKSTIAHDHRAPTGVTRWCVRVMHCNKFDPFQMPRKSERVKPTIGVHRRIMSIVPVEDGPATCFEVEHPSRLFVCQDFIVTHNSLTLLMDFVKDVGKGHGKAWRGVLFRQRLGDLDDIIRKIEEWMPKMYPGFRFRKSKADYSAVWPSGEELLLRHMEDERAYGEYHGHEYPWIGWEELTQWPTDKPYKLMMSCCRPPASGVPCRVRSTTNPFGPGHNWVKRRFELPQKRGTVIRKPGEMPRVAVHGTLSENFLLLHEAPNYPMQVRQAATSPAQAMAWVEGRWDITAGGMIDDIWNRRFHVLPPIPLEEIPKGWTITRSYDHGQSSPFSVGWFLESNGEPLVIDGRLIGNVRGDIILWQEWYGTTGEVNMGVRLPARKIAAGIFDREVEWGTRNPVTGKARVHPGPADTEIFNRSSDRYGRCPADDMEDEGILWERADKSSGSRKRGWEMLRTRLSNAIPNPDGSREEPGFFVCENCSWWLELCPPMPRDDRDMDEVPSNYEDHAADMTRYRLNWELPGMTRRSF